MTKSMTTIFKELNNNRIERSNSLKTVKVIRLTKKGTPSQIPADTMSFSTVTEAQDYIQRFAKNNPTSTAKFIVQ